MEDLFITIFTDASFCPNTKATGWAVWMKYGANGTIVKHKGGYVSLDDEHSNDAELFGLEKAIEMCGQLVDHNRMVLKGKVVILQCDCQGALDKVNVTPLYRRGVQHVKRKWVQGHSRKVNQRTFVNKWCDVSAYGEMKILRHKKRKYREHLKSIRRKMHETNRLKKLNKL